VVARDVSGDVAVLRVDGMRALPYVARLADLDDLPKTGTEVTSIGIDLGTDFKSWDTRVKGIATMTREEKDARLFVLTEHAPEHGRSGGGLFLADGKLMGVCVGRIEERGSKAGKVTGIFASGPTIRRVVRQAARAN
jgi:S1-C subfamily serine protease